MDFSGKHVFVIGGSRGIGASCVEMLARRGASVGFSFISNADAANDVEVRASFCALVLHLLRLPLHVFGAARTSTSPTLLYSLPGCSVP
jgi:NAD(P)-dependent dehydrogenase (short-subunit alcohol dehydrogenase family)